MDRGRPMLHLQMPNTDAKWAILETGWRVERKIAMNSIFLLLLLQSADPTGSASTFGSEDTSDIVFPQLEGWQFYGTQNGGPREVLGVTSDQSGNVWVAGGEEGLFLLEPGSVTYRRYTMADGLRPYGYMPDGSDPPGEKYLKVISVSGGPPGTVFVGYQGKPPPAGQFDCETNFYGPRFNPPRPSDPSVYKSGDADKVILNTDRTLSVVHYDIFTGPNVIPNEDERAGREKLCNILRIVYDPLTQSVWFGGNHGFAWGDANFAGNPTCNGQLDCSGLVEHSHPAINAYADEARTSVILLTGEYYGMSVDPIGDLWAGGADRSTKFGYVTYGRDFFEAGAHVEGEQYVNNRLDIWPDLVAEPIYPTPSERVDDNVSDMAAMPDGSVWIGSFNQGLAHYTPGLGVEYFTDLLIPESRGYVTGLERDPRDNSIWVGYAYGGFARLQGPQATIFDYRVLGQDMVQGQIPDIQSDNLGGSRRVLVAFKGGAGRPGAIGIYSGD